MTHFPVMEHFYTLQGEGKFAGHAAYFIRLAGCDVGCSWCDVKESWTTDGFPLFTPDQLLQLVTDLNANRVVITGGEPTMHQLETITDVFRSNNIKTHIETAGVNYISGNWDWVCLSPKKFKNALPDSYLKADELKIIVFNQHDLSWCIEESEKVNERCLLYLQPEWSKKDVLLPIIIEFIKNNPKWQLSLQTHKYINIP